MMKNYFRTSFLIKTANGEYYDFCDVLPLCDADLMCLGLASAFETARREGQKGEYAVCNKAFQWLMMYIVICTRSNIISAFFSKKKRAKVEYAKNSAFLWQKRSRNNARIGLFACSPVRGGLGA